MRGAEIAQISLGDPRSWKGPVVEFPGGAPALREAAQQANLPLVVHAPFVINVASTNNRIRIPSRKLLQKHVDAAAEIGALGVVIHGGHVVKDADPADGFAHWHKAVDGLDAKVPIFIENTAGGQHAMACTLEAIERLWDSISTAAAFAQVGFCLDTCHAHAAGLELHGLVDRIKAITGRIDLVHANDSRDAFGSGADRHANLARARLMPPASSRWWPPPVPPPSWRRLVAPRTKQPTSCGCGTGLHNYDRSSRTAVTAIGGRAGARRPDGEGECAGLR